jgi:hypothetical protein
MRAPARAQDLILAQRVKTTAERANPNIVRERTRSAKLLTSFA